MGTSENWDSQLASRSVLNDFADDTLAISTGSLFENRTVRMLKASWRREVTTSLVAEFRGVAVDGLHWEFQ